MNSSQSRGFSLVLVIMLITILSIMTIILMGQQRYTNKLATKIANQFTQVILEQSQVNREVLIVKNRLKNVLNEKVMADSQVELSQDIWRFQYDSSHTSGGLLPQLGVSADDVFGFSLLVKNEGTPFVLSKGCYLDDDLILSDTLIQYSPPRLKFHDVIKGELRIQDEESETLVSYQLIEAYTSQFAQYLDQNKQQSIRTDRTSLAMEVIDRDKQVEMIAGDLSGPFYLETNDCLDTLVVSGTINFEQNSRFDKPLVLIAGMDVFLKDSLRAADMVIYTRGGLYLENQSQVRGTFYSEKQILVTDSARILFPSNLIVPKNDLKIYGQPEIAIVKNASVSGFVCVFDPEPKTLGQTRYSLAAKVKKDRTAKFFGGIYCDGSVEAYGRIDGFVRCDRFEQVIKRTRWVNYLQDITINRKSIGPDFPLPPFFNKPELTQVLRVEYL